jgi:hypothetical protein
MMEGFDENGNIEIIEMHGDQRLPDGTYLRNWTIVIAGRKKLIKFETNPIIINPFIKWCYEATEDGWSVSPIEYIMPLIDAGSNLLSLGVEGCKRHINPAWLSPEEAFEQKKHYLAEGKIIKYKPNLNNPNFKPEPIPVNAEAPFNFIQLFEGQSEATTGATRQLSGNVTTNDKVQTATEYQGLQVVGNMIIDRLVDLFNADFKIPIVEAVALVNAFFSPNSMKIPIDNDNGKREFKEIGPEVYYGNYEYIILDNKAELERKQHLKESAALFQQMLADPELAQWLKKVDFAKMIWRNLGNEKPGQYFKDDKEYIESGLVQFTVQAAMEMKAQQIQMALQMGIDPALIIAQLKEGLFGDAQEAQAALFGPPTPQVPPTGPAMGGIQDPSAGQGQPGQPGAISRLEYQLGNQASLERIAIQNEMHRMFKEGMLSVLTLVDRELIETKRLLNLPINEDEFES